MAHRGPGMRTPRTRALEIGTKPAGFEGAVDAGTYDANAGVPRSTPGVQGTYAGNVKGTIAQSNNPSKSVKSPFKLGGR